MPNLIDLIITALASFISNVFEKFVDVILIGILINQLQIVMINEPKLRSKYRKPYILCSSVSKVVLKF
jgi:hypothetical protein